jgi:hypothetical protein
MALKIGFARFKMLTVWSSWNYSTKRIMKRKNVAVFVFGATATLTLAAFAFDGNSSKVPGLFLLKSHGKTVAELHVLPGTDCAIESQGRSNSAEYDTATGTWRARGSVVLKVISGTNSITVSADEIEGGPVAK